MNNEQSNPERPARDELILQAAFNEFLAGGFAGTSMDRIAETAQVSKRTVYNHFPAKEILFRAVLDEFVSRISERARAEYALDAPLDSQLRVIGNSYASIITEPDFVRFSRVVISEAIRSPEMSGATRREQRHLRADIIRWIRARTEDGLLAIENAERAAAQFCGPIKEVALWPQLVGGLRPATEQQRTEAVDAAVHMFLNHYRKENKPS